MAFWQALLLLALSFGQATANSPPGEGACLPGDGAPGNDQCTQETCKQEGLIYGENIAKALHIVQETNMGEPMRDMEEVTLLQGFVSEVTKTTLMSEEHSAGKTSLKNLETGGVETEQSKTALFVKSNGTTYALSAVASSCSSGYRPIKSIAECTAAAMALGLGQTATNGPFVPGNPYTAGCYKNRYLLFFNPYGVSGRCWPVTWSDGAQHACQTLCAKDTCSRSNPANGGQGNCPASMAYGASCIPTCNSGYSRSGTTSCSSGTLTKATCKENVCSGCADGVGATNVACATDGGTTCASCNAGYNLLNGACEALTTCTAAQFESAAPTGTSDRICQVLTTCTAGQFESGAPTVKSDRQCQALTICTSAEFESGAPTVTSDRICQALITCTAGLYESAAPTSTSDRQCQAVTICTGAEFQSGAPTVTSDRICQALTTCTAGQDESAAPTSTSDRQCQAQSCTVSGLTAPQNGALDTACANAATLTSGSSCVLTCNSGYTISGAQPSCSTGTFASGSIVCGHDGHNGSIGKMQCPPGTHPQFDELVDLRQGTRTLTFPYQVLGYGDDGWGCACDDTNAATTDGADCGPLPITPAPITSAPTTLAPSTQSPSTPAPATPAVVTLAPITPGPTTQASGCGPGYVMVNLIFDNPGKMTCNCEPDDAFMCLSEGLCEKTPQCVNKGVFEVQPGIEGLIGDEGLYSTD